MTHTPEARQSREVKARAKLERQLRRDRALPAANLLIQSRMAGVVVLKGASAETLLDGLDDAVTKTRRIKQGHQLSQVLRLDAQGTVQGPDRGDNYAQEISDITSKHRREHGRNGIVVFTNFDFYNLSAGGTPYIHDHFLDQALKKSELERESHDIDPAILLVGRGTASHLPTHPDHDHYVGIDIPFGAYAVARLALQSNGELVTNPEFETYSATKAECYVAIAKQFKPGAEVSPLN